MSVTCSDHRENMRLLALRLRLTEDDLKPDERKRIEAEVEAIENELGLN